jgi:TolB protein
MSLTAALVLLGGQMPTDEIAFDMRRGGDFDIYLLDTQRNISVRLTHSDADEYSPAWSPDGESIAYVYENDSDRAIYVMQADGNSPRRLTEVMQITMNPSLAWSPDGSVLALATVDESDTQGIFLIDVDGANLRRLSESTGNAFTPTWSVGEQIAFSWSPVSNTEIWVMDIANPDSAHPITRHPLTDTSPAWSPDGLEIAFQSDRDGNTDIYLMNPNGENVRPITHDPSIETMPAWSPDGEHIAFISNRTGGSDLFVMRRDGTDIQQLTFGGAEYTRPAWRP